MYVLSFPLNVSVLVLSLIQLERLFHSFGPYTLNGLSGNVHLLVEGTSSWNWDVDECNPGCFIFFSVMSSCRYMGARLFWHLEMSVAILKSILSLIGSQWSEFIISIALLFQFFPIVILGAQFCTLHYIYVCFLVIQIAWHQCS